MVSIAAFVLGFIVACLIILLTESVEYSDVMSELRKEWIVETVLCTDRSGESEIKMILKQEIEGGGGRSRKLVLKLNSETSHFKRFHNLRPDMIVTFHAQENMLNGLTTNIKAFRYLVPDYDSRSVV